MASQRKPSIVFVHGLWADGSCFAKLIPTLQTEGFEVIASLSQPDFVLDVIRKAATAVMEKTESQKRSVA